jgi:hypothetical protein
MRQVSWLNSLNAKAIRFSKTSRHVGTWISMLFLSKRILSVYKTLVVKMVEIV